MCIFSVEILTNVTAVVVPNLMTVSGQRFAKISPNEFHCPVFGATCTDGIVCAGLAQIEGICGRSKVSVAHERGEYSSAQTTTHELGHKSVFPAFVSLPLLFIVAYTLFAIYRDYRISA